MVVERVLALMEVEAKTTAELMERSLRRRLSGEV